jgi:hypothetical protein
VQCIQIANYGGNRVVDYYVDSRLPCWFGKIARTADGSQYQITFGNELNYTQPAWSVDGKSLAAFRWIEDETAELGHLVVLALE